MKNVNTNLTVGDKRTIVKFAFFPTKINDKIIWFKEYVEVYEYSIIYTRNGSRIPALYGPNDKKEYKWILKDKVIYNAR